MASSSESKLKSTHGWTYDVFLSFAGKDTRKGFVGHLYRALHDKGIYTFKDDLCLRMGDSISDEILNSIEKSRISVVVFSGRYAYSSWCLDELVKIMECWKQIGQTVIPIFYNIKPSDVEKQEGALTNAFWKHEEKYKNDMGKVWKWKEALSEAACCSGCDIPFTANGNEADCIIKILQEISSKCHINSSATENLVGIIPRVREVRSLLETEPGDVRIIGIWGMGGAGKTTLAWEVYNEISNQFQDRSYVANIREVSKTSGLHFLQWQILSELLSEPNMKVPSELQGRKLMASRLRRKKILLVLDDVDDDVQLAALAGSRDWFRDGSRIIITTRDEHLLNKAKVDEIYTSAMLDDDEAIEFFSLNAFERSNPPEEFKEYLDRFVDYAAGLPLALKVLGSFLYGRGIDEWKSTLERLEVSPEEKIDEILRISFDGLRDTEQKIFLDIACFFKGWKRNHATKILESFDLCPGIGISVLIQKSLISVSGERLCMHDRMQEMGWHIVRKVSNNPGEHSRLWQWKDVENVLTSKTGTDAIEGIYLDVAQYRNGIWYSSDTFGSMGKLRFLYFNACHIWPLQSNWGFDLPSKRISKVAHYPPSNLQWIHWETYLADSLPESFLGEKLVGIELPNSRIVQLWQGRKNLDKLKFLDLRDSGDLRLIPDLTGTPNLRSLVLDECNSLEEVHPSVGDLKQLVIFSLRNCRELKSLPSRIQMDSLETLNLSCCYRLKKFPEIAESMGKLSKLYLDDTPIKELPKSIGNLTGLVIMSLCWCKNLRSLPGTICRLKCLKTLSLSYCSRLEKLPKNLGEIQSLEELFLDATEIREPPSSIVDLKNLKTLSLGMHMKPFLFASNSDSKFGSERPLLFSFGFVKKLIFSACNLSEREVPGDLSSLFSVEELDLSENPISYLPHSISQLPRLKTLEVSNCLNLKAVEELPSTIAILKADWCPSLMRLFDIKKYESLWKISLLNEREVRKSTIEFLLQALVQGHLVSNHRFSFFGSGDKIPKWFSDSEQNEWSDMYLQLTFNWCNGKILGFAICAALGNNYRRLIKIQFDMIEEKIQDFEVPKPFVGLPKYTNMWLGFMSIDFFKMLFPKLKQDNWTQFEGKLRMKIDRKVGECHMCAIRPVYEDDVEGAATIKNSAGLLNNSASLPRLKYLQDDGDDDDHHDYERGAKLNRIEDSSLGTVCFEQKGHMSAKVQFEM